MPSSLLFLISLFLLFPFLLPVSSEPPNCLAVYREGGAPAVFQSPKCPRWILPSSARFRQSTPGCHMAVNQGRRRYLEDRVVCELSLRIPFLSLGQDRGKMIIKEVDVGIIAIFDGHNGAEASEMASKLLMEYFLLHVYFQLDGLYSVTLEKLNGRLTFKDAELLNQLQPYGCIDKERLDGLLLTNVFEDSFHMEILKESLVKAIHDIDSTFSKEALLNGIKSGSTAAVVLVADGQYLAANVGDSKAFMCSEAEGRLALDRRNRIKRRQFRTSNSEIASNGGEIESRCHVKELTFDHHPDREDERRRVEAAGGNVTEWAGVVRINDQLAVSRAIGDVYHKQYGVISTPEVAGWRSISRNDTFLVATSDGVVEKLTTQDACDILFQEKVRLDMIQEGISSTNLAELLLTHALERGTMDNVAAVVVPLLPVSGYRYRVEEVIDNPAIKLQATQGNDANYGSIFEKDYYDLMTARFHRSLIEAKNKGLGCFYLSESLDEYSDYIFRDPEDYNSVVIHDSFLRSESAFVNNNPLEVYKDNDFCWFFYLQDETKDHCRNPEAFRKFIGLLDSVPDADTKSNASSEFDYDTPDFRYKLKRKFDRGSYGEVWLAFHWSCSQDMDELSNSSQHYSHSSNNNISSGICFTNLTEGDLFILKRIMVERGNAAYISGIREKYFGELFSNASKSLDCLLVDEQYSGYNNIYNPSYNFAVNYSKKVNEGEEGLKHIARFVESFVSKSNEIWLVFQNEGISLSKMVYTAEEMRDITGDDKREEKAKYVKVVRPSKWWYWLRTTNEGQKQMRDLLYQLLMAVKACHDRNITHRDIKPENMIICFEDLKTGKCSREIPDEEKKKNLHMRLIDFGSAIDDFTMKHLYGNGPTRSEQTFEYTPPEALLNTTWYHVPNDVRMKYDLWSIGVVMLELIMGSPHVFELSARTQALLDQQLEGWGESTRELACKLRSYMELCILIPGLSSHHHQGSHTFEHVFNFDKDDASPASWKCSEESFSQQVKMRDPLKLGFPNIWALRLARQLLVWHPEDRLTVDEALNHPYFKS
ncbi:kinase superfamily protein isoform X2 [Carex rostrata]